MLPPMPSQSRISSSAKVTDKVTELPLHAPDHVPYEGARPASRSFAARQHWLGWQGFTLTLPSDWNLASYGGDTKKGTLRIDDGDAPRIELRWETPNAPVNLEKSIDDFVQRMARDAKKKKRAFHAADHPAIVAKSRKPKVQLVNFGWTGDDSQPMASHGWGTAWQCADCGRIVVAHLIGRASEKPRVAQQLATEIFTSLECHGQGGWQAWSVFALSAEIPNEFVLSRAKLQTGKLEIEWQRPVPTDWHGWGARPERIVLRRYAAANLMLENQELSDWAHHSLIWPDKKTVFGDAREETLDGHEGLLLDGGPRPVKQRIIRLLRQKLRQSVTHAELRIWHDTGANKVLTLETELTPANAHVTQDVMDSLNYE